MPASSWARSSAYMRDRPSEAASSPGASRRQVEAGGVGAAHDRRQAQERLGGEARTPRPWCRRCRSRRDGSRTRPRCRRASAPNRSATPATSDGATNRNTAAGSTKRRISQGQAMRSILGRARVTQTVRPRLSRGGSLASGTSGRPACRQASNPPASTPPATPSCRSQAATPSLSFCPRWQTTIAGAAREFRGPCRWQAMRPAHRAGDQAGIGREILLGADIDDRRAFRRADRGGQASRWQIVVDRRHAASSGGRWDAMLRHVASWGDRFPMAA